MGQIDLGVFLIIMLLALKFPDLDSKIINGNWAINPKKVSSRRYEKMKQVLEVLSKKNPQS